MLSLLISVLPGSVIQPFAVITYCLAVFNTPLLLIIYGHKYLGGAKDWSWEIVPLLAETLLSILFVGLNTPPPDGHLNCPSQTP